MKPNFMTHNPLFELKDKVHDLQKKNERLSILVIVVSVLSVAAIAALLAYKFSNRYDFDDFDDDFDYFDDDFEDIDESDFE